MAALPPPASSSRRSRESGQMDAVVGQFKIQMEIGKGSFATVYRAIHVKNRSLVAIKSVHLQKLNKKLKENLYSEIDILKGLHHPHIVALIDCQESAHHIHLVMEFCQLGDLSYFIKKRDRLVSHPATADMMKKYPSPPGGGLNEVIVRHFLKQLSSALEFLRARNFIHRDVKPQNLLLNPSPLYLANSHSELPYAASENSLVPVVGVESLPMLKIADFGFARSLPSTSLAETLCGSPLYMAPEILRYEKYDAKADLWSVGTVLYEMMAGRPPFRASNHVELLRKIERGDDRIGFPEGVPMTDGMKRLIRGLLKRNPVERMGFKDFFDHAVVKDDIPGLVGEDRMKQSPNPASDASTQHASSSKDSRQSNADREERDEARNEPSQASRDVTSRNTTHSSTNRAGTPTSTTRPYSGTPPRPGPGSRRVSGSVTTNTPSQRDRSDRDRAPSPRRPSITSHATAPTRPEQLYDRGTPIGDGMMARQSSRDRPSSRSSTRERDGRRRDERASKDVTERAEQEVAFERDYVVVEKRAVEVNAFADELAASPRIHGAYQNAPTTPHQGAMTRRATTQGQPGSATGAQVTPSRALQIATGKQLPDAYHRRQSSYERRYGASPASATSAISKALNMANFRLFGVGFSPPFVAKSGHSPPQTYGAFPAYPTTHGSLVMIGDGGKTGIVQDEDSRAVQIIEESATRSDVVYGFAEVKYKQLIPLAPSVDRGLGLRAAGLGETREGEGEQSPGPEDEGLTVDAIVTLSEEALVLYVKALSLLARAMDIARAWWARKTRREVAGESPRSEASAAGTIAAGNRINNVVQWVRSRFNEVLEKAEFVARKLVDAQKQLPYSHPSHPSNHPTVSTSSTRLGTSTDAVVVGSGVTAEKLMYDRALEMSRAAAVNELLGDDLPGCEIAYVTAVRMLEAVLEGDEGCDRDERPIDGMEVEDRKVVEKLVASMRGRLQALRKKMAMISKRQSTHAPPSQSYKPRGAAPPPSPPSTTSAMAHLPPTSYPQPSYATTPP
ncbi:MAG: Serine/threonine-protein kinase [Thelocarpon superellum]|nr:MAG: Serine/threonine-protein kinase [Thelocarpon superellum]